MRKFKSYSAAINSILPNKTDMRRLGTILMKHYKERLKSNNATGKKLSNVTIERKRKRGSSTPNTKLVEGGGLMNQIIKIVETAKLEVGYDDTIHDKLIATDKDISTAKLANIHHNSKRSSLPQRKFLYLDKEEYKIVGDWLAETLRRKVG